MLAALRVLEYFQPKPYCGTQILCDNLDGK
jgi:hypothetical protein